MRKQSKYTNKRLENLINNTILISLIEQGLEIEFILYISEQ
jgi:hypothetical protein